MDLTWGYGFCKSIFEATTYVPSPRTLQASLKISVALKPETLKP